MNTLAPILGAVCLFGHHYFLTKLFISDLFCKCRRNTLLDEIFLAIVVVFYHENNSKILVVSKIGITPEHLLHQLLSYRRQTPESVCLSMCSFNSECYHYFQTVIFAFTPTLNKGSVTLRKSGCILNPSENTNVRRQI